MKNLKDLSLFMLIVNCIYFAYTIILLIYLREHFILDLNNPPLKLKPNIWLSTQEVGIIFVLIMFVGTIVILAMFKERMFIVLSVVLHLMLRLFFDVMGILVAFGLVSATNPIIPAGSYISIFALLYFLLSVCFIKSDTIKSYYIWFAVASVVAILFPPVSGYLFNNFNLPWVLINPGIIKLLPFVVTLLLFIRMNKTSPLEIS